MECGFIHSSIALDEPDEDEIPLVELMRRVDPEVTEEVLDAFARTRENLLTAAPVELVDIVGSTASGVEDSDSSSEESVQEANYEKSYKELVGCIRKLKYHYAIAGDPSGNNLRSVLSLEKSADEQAFASMRQVKITKFFH